MRLWRNYYGCLLLFAKAFLWGFDLMSCRAVALSGSCSCGRPTRWVRPQGRPTRWVRPQPAPGAAATKNKRKIGCMSSPDSRVVRIVHHLRKRRHKSREHYPTTQHLDNGKWQVRKITRKRSGFYPGKQNPTRGPWVTRAEQGSRGAKLRIEKHTPMDGNLMKYHIILIQLFDR